MHIQASIFKMNTVIGQPHKGLNNLNTGPTERLLDAHGEQMLILTEGSWESLVDEVVFEPGLRRQAGLQKGKYGGKWQTYNW